MGGQVGDGTTTERQAPVALTGIYSAGTPGTLGPGCVVASDGTGKCNIYGSGTGQYDLFPIAAGWVTLQASVNGFRCGLAKDGLVYCQGASFVGAIGNGNADGTMFATPQEVAGQH